MRAIAAQSGLKTRRSGRLFDRGSAASPPIRELLHGMRFDAHQYRRSRLRGYIELGTVRYIRAHPSESRGRKASGLPPGRRSHRGAVRVTIAGLPDLSLPIHVPRGSVGALACRATPVACCDLCWPSPGLAADLLGQSGLFGPQHEQAIPNPSPSLVGAAQAQRTAVGPEPGRQRRCRLKPRPARKDRIARARARRGYFAWLFQASICKMG